MPSGLIIVLVSHRFQFGTKTAFHGFILHLFYYEEVWIFFHIYWPFLFLLRIFAHILCMLKRKSWSVKEFCFQFTQVLYTLKFSANCLYLLPIDLRIHCLVLQLYLPYYLFHLYLKYPSFPLVLFQFLASHI